jgi:hypothetical protein
VNWQDNEDKEVFRQRTIDSEKLRQEQTRLKSNRNILIEDEKRIFLQDLNDSLEGLI